MSFTRYWKKVAEVNEKQYEDALKDIIKIVKNKRALLAGGDGSEGTKPTLTNGIAFNGIGDASHETFALPPKAAQLEGFDFCKTNEKPYDIVVAAVLARLAEVDGIKVSCDGDSADWQQGVKLASKVLGRPVKNPAGSIAPKEEKASYLSEIEAHYNPLSSRIETIIADGNPKLEDEVAKLMANQSFIKALPDFIAAAKAGITVAQQQDKPDAAKFNALSLALCEAIQKKDVGAANKAASDLVKAGHGEAFGLK